MPKLIKIKVGDKVPEGARFIAQEETKELAGRDTHWGLFWDTRITYYKTVTYYVYEIDEKEN